MEIQTWTRHASRTKEESQSSAWGAQYGSADSAAIAEFEKDLLDKINGSPVGLLVDMGQTVCIGCGFLNVLLGCQQSARRLKRKLALCQLSPLPKHVLAISRLDSLWDVFGLERTAVEALQRPGNSRSEPRL